MKNQINDVKAAILFIVVGILFVLIGIMVYFQFNTATGQTSLIVLMFPGIGLLVMVGGISDIWRKLKKKKQTQQLIETGERIEGEYVQAVYNVSYSIHGVTPYYIKCQWKDELTGKIYFFESDNMLFNPIPIIQENHITTFPIYVDRNDKNKYTVVLDSIKQNIVDLS